MSCHKNEKKSAPVPIFYQPATGSTGVFLGLTACGGAVMKVLVTANRPWRLRRHSNALQSPRAHYSVLRLLRILRLLRPTQHVHSNHQSRLCYRQGTV